MIPVTIFNGKEVAIFGVGRSGLTAAQALQAGGAEPLLWDDSEKGRAAAKAQGFAVADLNSADWSRFAALVLAPGVPLTHPRPHWTVERAKAAGVEIIGDNELFCRQHRAEGSRARIIAITGTNGKSTTTALTAHILSASGRRVAMGGNIGTAVLALEPFADDLTYVLEYSSYQIDLTPGLHADAACLLNITPDHIDRHGTLEHYATVKARIFDGLGPAGVAVIGVDDELSAAIADRMTAGTGVRRISVRHPVTEGLFLRDGALVEAVWGKDAPPVKLAGIGSLRGVHNAQNAAAAFALCRAIGLSREEIAAGLETFPGLAHRMEPVARIGRVLFVNDSKATNADAAEKALASFDDIYWIAGGIAKDGGLAGLESYFPKIRRAYFIGAAAESSAREVGGGVPHRISGTLETAVHEAAADAGVSDAAEPAVLLSPACASFDQFSNFEIRGDAFRTIVEALAAGKGAEHEAV
ncbi:MAG: UDP-N-acetylmuramoyl-L-alanine--D-glutamate ligase [Hyphomicrobiales bacterium]|nr:UDP-N-acetylmuramoyl-L-alanine--D-glutamate ligase [Hyphomicrobiales bacterium]